MYLVMTRTIIYRYIYMQSTRPECDIGPAYIYSTYILVHGGTFNPPTPSDIILYLQLLREDSNFCIFLC